MASSKALTIMEILVSLIIVGILVSIAIPDLFSYMEQTKAQAARNNLLAISAAQQKYFEDYGSYCLAGCGDSTPNIDSFLHLGISDKFSYSCSNVSLPYQCTAADGADTLTLTVSATGASVSCSGPNHYCPS